MICRFSRSRPPQPWIAAALLVAASFAVISTVMANAAHVQSTPGTRPASRWPSEEVIIAVARDVSPSWAESLEAARTADAKAFADQLRELRQLRSLAVLRDRRPAVYQQRIKELQSDYAIRELGTAYRSAIAAGDTERALELEHDIGRMSVQLVDANLRSRATELSELDALIRAMREELKDDSVQRLEQAEAISKALLAGEPMPTLGGRTSPRQSGAEPAQTGLDGNRAGVDDAAR